MSHSPLDRNQLRRRLDDVLRTDPDLNAFCLDYFPEVHRRFTGGMERTEKVNLLLQLASEPDKIPDKLGAYSAAPPEKTPRPAGRPTPGDCRALCLGCRNLRHSFLVPPRADPSKPHGFSYDDARCGLAGSPAVPVDVNSGNVIDKSADAEMHNSARLPAEKPPARINSGNRIQGSRGAKMDNRVTVTPWTMHLDAPA